MHMHDILGEQLQRFATAFELTDLEILETGTIRQDTPEHQAGDGWSTLAFARWAEQYGGHVTSIDLHVATAAKVLAREKVDDYVTLRPGYSIDWMASMLKAGQEFDVILLDSENDGQLILHEFMLAMKLLRRPGLLLVDDVVPQSRAILKGELLVPWLDDHGMDYSLIPRTGGGVQSQVLATLVLP